MTVSPDTSPPPVTGACTGGTSTAPVAGCNPEDGEAQLDTEQTASLAKDANVLFYLGYSNSGGSAVQGLDDADNELQQAINDNQADILSLSYGGCEILTTALGTLMPDAARRCDGHGPDRIRRTRLRRHRDLRLVRRRR